MVKKVHMNYFSDTVVHILYGIIETIYTVVYILFDV